jgi:hypothetical protein
MSEPKHIARDFSHLKKPVSIEINAEVQEKLIAFLEGDLAEEEANTWERKIAIYPEVKKEFALFKQTKLTAPEQAFKGKQNLYKKGKGLVMPMYFNRWLAAASLLVISSLFWFLFEPTNETKQVAVQQPLESFAAIDKQENETKKDVVSLPKSTSLASTRMVKSAKAVRSNLLIEKVEAMTLTTKRTESISIANNLADLVLVQEEMPVINAQKPIQSSKQNNYLNPKDWLVGKLKKQLPETGIVVQHNIDEEQNSHKLLIASRYFSYEKVSYQKQN